MNSANLKLLTLVASLVSYVSVAGAGTEPKSYYDLLQWPTRPPIEYIFDINIPPVQGVPTTALRTHPRMDPLTWSQIQERHADKLIAQLEYLFPGATWAFMGRDTEAHADLVEAFYLKLGQRNRVVRIGISKPTFWDNEGTGQLFVTDEQIVKSLESYGFSLTNLHESPPMILIDTLSKGSGRQGRVIINAVYRTYAKSGANPADLVHRFNMVGLATSTFGTKVASVEKAKQALQNLAVSYRMQLSTKQERLKISYFDHHPISILPHAAESFHECGYEHFVGAWNERFGAYETDSYGRLRAKYGPINDQLIRANILWSQKQIVEMINNPIFIERVRRQASALGYEFPSERQSAPFKSGGYVLKEELQALNTRNAEVGSLDKLSLGDLENHLHQLPAHINRSGPSPAGQAILEFIAEKSQRYSKLQIAAKVLQVSLAMHRVKVVTTNDLRAVIRELVLLCPPSGIFLKLLNEAMSLNPALTSTITRSMDWIDPDHANISNLETIRYLLDEGRDDPNCEHMFGT